MNAIPQPVFIVPRVAGLDIVRPAQLRRLSQIERPQEPQSDSQASGSQPLVSPQGSLRQNGWLWLGRFATGKVTVLVGENGLGKSSIAADLAARVSRGSAWPGQDAGSAPQGTALVISPAEEQCGLLTTRLEGAGADLDCVCAMPLEPLDDVPIGSATVRPRLIVERLALVQSALEALPDCKLVVIDSLSLFLDGPDGRRSGAAAVVMLGLAKLARKFGVAIVVVAHLNGTASLRSFSQFTAMLGPPSIGRSVWGVLRDPEDADRQLMVSLDGNFGKTSETLRFRLATRDTGKCLVGGATGKRSLPVSGEVDSFVEDAVADQHWQTALASGTQVDQHRQAESSKGAGLASGTYVEWEAAAPTSLRQVLGAYSGFRISERKYRDTEDYVAVRLREVLAAGAVEKSDIRREIQASDEQLYRGAKGLGVVMQKSGFYGNWVWMLPEYFPKWQAQQEQKRRDLQGDREDRKNAKRKQRRAERRREREAAAAMPSSAAEKFGWPREAARSAGSFEPAFNAETESKTDRQFDPFTPPREEPPAPRVSDAAVGDASRASPEPPSDLVFQARAETCDHKADVERVATSESTSALAFASPLEVRDQGVEAEGAGAVSLAAAESPSELALPTPLGSRDLPHGISTGSDSPAAGAPVSNFSLLRPPTAEDEEWHRALTEKLRAREAELEAAYQLSQKGEITAEDEERYCWVEDWSEEDLVQERGEGARDGPRSILTLQQKPPFSTLIVEIREFSRNATNDCSPSLGLRVLDGFGQGQFAAVEFAGVRNYVAGRRSATGC
jgi:hypothetical protein